MFPHRLRLLAALLALVVAAVPAAAETLQLAQVDAAEIAFWESVQASDNPDELRAYLDAYPAGHFAALAKIRLRALGAETLSEGEATASGPAVEDPRSLAPYAFQEGLRLISEGRSDAGFGMLQMAVARDPERALYREGLAEAYLADGGELALYFAIEEFQQALEREPGRQRSLEGLRQAALLADQPLIALEATETLFLGQDQIDQRYLADLTALYMLLDQTERGLSRLEAALPRSPNPLLLKLSMAALHQYRAEPDQVVLLAHQVMDESPPESREAAMAKELLAVARADQ